MVSPPKLLPWFEVRVRMAYSALPSTYALSHRRTIVALAQWRAGTPLAHHLYVDDAGTRELVDPTEVDWSGFPPPAAGSGSEP